MPRIDSEGDLATATPLTSAAAHLRLFDALIASDAFPLAENFPFSVRKAPVFINDDRFQRRQLAAV